jgi:hypothetical protein
MNKLMIALFAVALAAPASAQSSPAPKEPKPKVEVVSLGEDGKPDVVRVDGYTMKVCKGDVQDGCINPQDAGFDWGGREINYWPGRPASEIPGPLPVEKPATTTTAAKDPG